MPPIFISYSSKDQAAAETVCTALENRGFSCWIAVRDVGPGQDFQEAIVAAIEGAPAMVLVFTENANNSDEIKKELVLTGQHQVIVIPVRVENIKPRGAFAYQLATRQWIDLFNDWERGLQRLAAQVESIIGKPAQDPVPAPDAPKPEARPAQEVGGDTSAAAPASESAAAPPRRALPARLLWPQGAFKRAAVLLLAAVLALVAYVALDPALQRRVEARVMATLDPPVRTITLAGYLNSAALAPDGKRIAVITHTDPADRLQLFSLDSGQAIAAFAGAQRLRDVKFSPDGKWLAAGSKDNAALIWDAGSHQLVRTLRHTTEVAAVAFSPDGRLLATGGDDFAVRLWEAASGRLLRTMTGHQRAVLALAFSPDGRRLASGAAEDVMRMWDVATGALVYSWQTKVGYVNDLTFSPDGSTVLSAGDDHDGFIAWYANDGKPSFTRKGYAPFSVAYSPGGQQIAVGGLDDVTLWTQFGQLKKAFYGHAKKVNNVAFTPDARQLVSASYDGTIKVWTVPPYGP